MKVRELITENSLKTTQNLHFDTDKAKKKKQKKKTKKKKNLCFRFPDPS